MSYNGIGKTVSFGKKKSEPKRKRSDFGREDNAEPIEVKATDQRLFDDILRCVEEKGIIPTSPEMLRSIELAPSKNVDGKLYSPINQQLLLMDRVLHDYDCAEYITPIELKKRHGKLKEGSNWSVVVYPKIGRLDETEGKWIWSDNKADKLKAEGHIIGDKKWFGYGGHIVYNLSLTDLPYEKVGIAETIRTEDDIKVDAIWNEFLNCYKDKPKIIESSEPQFHNAYGFYMPIIDVIHILPRKMFAGSLQYVDVLAHELTHSTEAPNRLNIPQGKRPGDTQYCKNEMRAEFGASILCSQLGLDMAMLYKSAEYIESYGKKIRALGSKGFCNLYASAFMSAERAVKYMRTGEKPQYLTDTKENAA